MSHGRYRMKAPFGGVAEAKRYCGRVTVRVSFLHSHGVYRCALSVGGKPRGVLEIRPPAYLENAVDSPKAFDSTAGAALSFAVADDLISDSELSYADDGSLDLRRKKP
jgi:hypothetical protein